MDANRTPSDWSPRFSLLPLEIRTMIYSYLTGLRSPPMSTSSVTPTKILTWTDLYYRMNCAIVCPHVTPLSGSDTKDSDTKGSDTNEGEHECDIFKRQFLRTLTRTCGISPFAAFLSDRELSKDFPSGSALSNIKIAQCCFKEMYGARSAHCLVMVPHCLVLQTEGLTEFVESVITWVNTEICSAHTEHGYFANWVPAPKSCRRYIEIWLEWVGPGMYTEHHHTRIRRPRMDCYSPPFEEFQGELLYETQKACQLYTWLPFQAEMRVTTRSLLTNFPLILSRSWAQSSSSFSPGPCNI